MVVGVKISGSGTMTSYRHGMIAVGSRFRPGEGKRMNVDLLRGNADARSRPMGPSSAMSTALTKEQLIRKVGVAATSGNMNAGLRLLSDYVGATHFLLARYDLVQEQGLDFVVTSNWPFDLVRRVETELASAYSRTT